MNKLIKMYVEAYESGANDLRSLNKWLKEHGVKLVAKNGKIIDVVAV
jgi:hypothetical protein